MKLTEKIKNYLTAILVLVPLFFYTLWYGRKELNKLIKELNMLGEPYSLRHPYKFAFAFLLSLIFFTLIYCMIIFELIHLGILSI